MDPIGAVVFDLDGVLLDSEQVWDTARRDLTTERGGRWRQDATRAMMGMSSTEWSAYMHDELSVPLAPMDIAREVVERIEDRLWGTAAANPRIEGGRCPDGGPVATRTG